MEVEVKRIIMYLALIIVVLWILRWAGLDLMQLLVIGFLMMVVRFIAFLLKWVA